MAARSNVKVFSLEDLGGKGRKSPTKNPWLKNRMTILDHIRRISDLTSEQDAQWNFFKETWDKCCAEAHCGDWAEIFMQMMQGLMNNVVEGQRTEALSQFMSAETSRVLGGVPAICLPAFTRDELT